ncbi:MAG TPA: hypothetical protein VKB78_12405, partial [Pirellulales bacterium]|nr:hypothetical protein [Pirellulales bacterium]
KAANRDAYPSTESLLLGGNIHEVLRSRGVKRLLLSSSCQPSMQAWADKHGILMLAARLRHQRQLENKLWFDRFLRRIGLPCPPGGAITIGRPLPGGLHAPLVLQLPDSLGGEGTYYLSRADDLPAIIAKANLVMGARCLARRFQPGTPYGISIFVAPGLIALSAVRRQCYYPAEANSQRLRFAGVQWIAGDELSAKAHRAIDRTMLRLGAELYRLRYVGVANVDFLLDSRDRVWLIECNPRMSAATPQLFAHPELCGGLPLGELFLRSFVSRRRYPEKLKCFALPKCQFRGATLDILLPQRDALGEGNSRPLTKVTRSPGSGRYRMAGGRVKLLGPDVRVPATHFADEISLFSFAMAGQWADLETTLATVLADQPLYDADGRFNESAERWLDYFRYTRG